MLRTLVAALLLVAATSAEARGPTGVPADLPDGLEENAEAQVLATLGAPHTAHFRRLHGYRLSTGGWVVCGEVNSRNLTGLSMGWKPIYVRYRGEAEGFQLARRIVDWPADVACRQLIMGRPLRARD